MLVHATFSITARRARSGASGSAEELRAALVAWGPAIEERQFAIVDVRGAVAGYTGSETHAYAGHRCGEGVVGREAYPCLDLHVDEHADPITELRRVYGVWREVMLPQLPARPTRAGPQAQRLLS